MLTHAQRCPTFRSVFARKQWHFKKINKFGRERRGSSWLESPSPLLKFEACSFSTLSTSCSSNKCNNIFGKTQEVLETRMKNRGKRTQDVRGREIRCRITLRELSEEILALRVRNIFSSSPHLCYTPITSTSAQKSSRKTFLKFLIFRFACDGFRNARRIKTSFYFPGVRNPHFFSRVFPA